ncbi:MAG TPA: SPOR domain-containing protein [Dokdonella sp.]|uniref:SPOR domain-containing protein n=1 Tax=Dokdonella sp. TaxID=2291710 RepID=UPI002BF63326|nr:SPOR domain-containing protein [Dokdonella sp.]HUD42925.1 SPOR domain-containing protein [Dokdonella sp.]
MDISLKQRLLGAAVLIALAIIFVPMFLSGSGPKQESETVSLQIPPAPDREFQTRVLPVEPASPSPSPSAAAPAGPAPAPPSDALATVDIPPRAEPPPTASTAPAPEPVPVPGPAATAPAAPDRTAPASPAAAAGIAANGRYFVHLGDYGNTKNADDLVAGLKRGGFAAFAEPSAFQGKQTTRVRVGPYADRAAAEAARLRIAGTGVKAPSKVVESSTDAVADAPAPAAAPARAGGWAVQLGAFKTREEADKLRERLRAAQFAAFVDQTSSNGQILWRVRAGPEAGREGATRLRDRIKEKLKLDGLVVTQP